MIIFDNFAVAFYCWATLYSKHNIKHVWFALCHRCHRLLRQR